MRFFTDLPNLPPKALLLLFLQPLPPLLISSLRFLLLIFSTLIFFLLHVCSFHYSSVLPNRLGVKATEAEENGGVSLTTELQIIKYNSLYKSLERKSGRSQRNFLFHKDHSSRIHFTFRLSFPSTH